MNTTEELEQLRLRIFHRRQTAYNKLTHIHELPKAEHAALTEELAALDLDWSELEGKGAGDE